MASSWAASSGLISSSIAWRVSVPSAATRFEKTICTRRSGPPERSKAWNVFSKVASAGSAAIARSSSRCWAMPERKAGRKCSSEMAAKSGRP